MKIELTEGVFYDTEQTQQTDEARAWLRENVLNRLGCTKGEEGMINPTLDAHGRPIRWTARFDNFTVAITREYVEPNGYSWAMKNEHLDLASAEGASHTMPSVRDVTESEHLVLTPKNE